MLEAALLSPWFRGRICYRGLLLHTWSVESRTSHPLLLSRTPPWSQGSRESTRTVAASRWTVAGGTTRGARPRWNFRARACNSSSHRLLGPGYFGGGPEPRTASSGPDPLLSLSAARSIDVPHIQTLIKHVPFSGTMILHSQIYESTKNSNEIQFGLTVSPLVKMRDFTRSQMFSSTRSSICWNRGTWKFKHTIPSVLNYYRTPTNSFMSSY